MTDEILSASAFKPEFMATLQKNSLQKFLDRGKTGIRFQSCTHMNHIEQIHSLRCHGIRFANQSFRQERECIRVAEDNPVYLTAFSDCLRIFAIFDRQSTLGKTTSWILFIIRNLNLLHGSI